MLYYWHETLQEKSSQDNYSLTDTLTRLGDLSGLIHRDNIERIGNSVPPLLMEAIARHIRIEILNKGTNNPTL